jgi:DNA-binding GntR family transcriptional regulator
MGALSLCQEISKGEAFMMETGEYQSKKGMSEITVRRALELLVRDHNRKNGITEW